MRDAAMGLGRRLASLAADLIVQHVRCDTGRYMTVD